MDRSISGALASVSTDLTLLDRVKNQDERAWRLLVAWAGPLVHYWCRAHDLTKEDRAEIFQEVFLAVLRNIGAFQRADRRGSFRGWLRTITTNKILDLARQRIKNPEATGGSSAYQRLLQTAMEPEEETVPGEPDSRRACLQRALAVIRTEIAETTWLAFSRTVIDGQSAPEAAAELGLTPAAVRQAKSRVLQRLRQEVDVLLSAS
jgi:RNA polymerase sigma-70 factor (ECF subfamily)